MSITSVQSGATAPRSYRRAGGDKTRRNRWLEEVSEAVRAGKADHGALAWAMRLAKRSNSTLSRFPFGRQTGQADEINRCDRQVRRYRRQLEDAGLIETFRGRVRRGKDGRFYRQETNRYCFVVPPRPKRQKTSSHRGDIDVPLNPLSTRDIETSTPVVTQVVDKDPPPVPFGFDRRHFDEARRRLRPE